MIGSIALLPRIICEFIYCFVDSENKGFFSPFTENFFLALFIALFLEGIPLFLMNLSLSEHRIVVKESEFAFNLSSIRYSAHRLLLFKLIMLSQDGEDVSQDMHLKKLLDFKDKEEPGPGSINFSFFQESFDTPSFGNNDTQF